MAAKPKLTPDQWAEIRARWETDPRDGYLWVVEEMGLPVSAPAVRKVSVRDGWTKQGVSAPPPPSESTGEDAKVSQGKVSRNLPERYQKPSETIPENTEETNKEKPRAGRPSLYREEYAEQAYKLCLLGAINADLADFFGVSTQTINAWRETHPAFLDSLKRGKEAADANVAESLYKRAIGYSHPDVHISNYQGVITVTDITKHYPPDTAAAFIWLKNRRPRQWKDKVEVKEEVNLNLFPSREVLKEVFDESLRRSAEKAALVAGRRERLGIVIDAAAEQDVD